MHSIYIPRTIIFKVYNAAEKARICLGMAGNVSS